MSTDSRLPIRENLIEIESKTHAMLSPAERNDRWKIIVPPLTVSHLIVTVER